MICDGLTTAAKVLLEVEDYIEEGAVMCRDMQGGSIGVVTAG